MATPSGATTPAWPPPPANSAIPSIVPAPYAENDQHVCFICLQNENDTPNATWVHPCPCTLEAHQDCMLQWVAEMEVSNRKSKNGLQCPACKAPIIVEEPYDAIVALRNRFNRKFSRISPGLLVLIVSECSVVGAASYGFAAVTIFAGRRAAMSMVDKIGVIPTVITCSLIGPGLVLSRWLASLGNLVLLPVSALYSTFLVGRNQPLVWPPSPVWAIALMPSVQFAYTFLYYELFGKLEKRLNRALRGRPMDEEPRNEAEQQQPPTAAGAAPANGQQQQQQGGQQQGGAGGNQREGEHGEEGMWDLVANLGRAVAGLFGDDDEAEGDLGDEDRARVEDLVFEVELHLDAGGHDHDHDHDHHHHDHDNDQEELQHILHEHLLNDVALAAPPVAVPPPAQPAQQQQQQPQNPPPQPNNNNNNNRRNRNRDNEVARPPPGPNGEGETNFLSLFLNSIVSSLLMPVISFGMGEAIRVLAPKSWVTRSLFQRDSFWSSIWGGSGRRRINPSGGTGNGTYAPSILQHQWGRSLVGGCLYVVLRDAWSLYVKWRRVQVKQNRRVKNVERRPAVREN
ncbi:hypothetical protein B0T21DRAFT_360692 [Apiosordaria backusii]|uniref:RING-CH-type domain-containing protein n=1 Tax=Apiosordaria backusii TaxID=314023 RepID=A0AA40EMP6_9PEZI|nr:hypothetical protein B0T21DRAFT_360692 [Apiosordaria backusii]